MTSPPWRSTTESTETTWTKTHTISLGSYQPGDTLIASWGQAGGGGTLTPPAGWTQIFGIDLFPNLTLRWYCWAKDMDGSEGSTITVSTSKNNRSASQVIRLSGARTGLVEGTAWDVEFTTSGYGTTIDPPSATATWGAADQTVIAMMYAGGNASSVTTYPGSYSNTVDTESTAMVASATREVSTATEDPSAFTISNSNNHRGATLIIREAAAVVAGAETATGTGTGHDGTADPPTTNAPAETATGTGTAYWAEVVTPQVAAGLKVEWDFDGDGDFDQVAIEDITTYVESGEVIRGRGFPSQVTGRSIPGEIRLRLRNDDDRFSYFNTGSPLNQNGNSLDLGRLLRVRTTESTPDDPTELIRDDMTANGPLDVATSGETWFTRSPTGFSVFAGEARADGPPAAGGTTAENPGALSWASLENSTAITLALRAAAGETISLRSSSELTVTGTATSHNATAPATIEADDLLIGFCSTQENPAAGAPSTPTGFTQRFSVGGVGTFRPEITCFYKIADGTEDSATITLDWGATNVETHAVWFALDGVDTGNPFDLSEPAAVEGTVDPDPPAMGSPTSGLAWVLAVVAANDTPNTAAATVSTGFTSLFDQSGDARAFVVAYKEQPAAGTEHIATVLAGQHSYYAQTIIPRRDTVNEVGLLVDWTDADNYNLIYLSDKVIQVVEKDAGATATLTSASVENRDDVALGVAHHSDGSIIVYIDGVQALSTTSNVATTGILGIYGKWFSQRPPAFDEFIVWTRSRITQSWESVNLDGIRGTMSVTKVTPTVDSAQRKTVEVIATGLLGQLDRPITAPSSIGCDDLGSVGIRAGHGIGNTLHRVAALHPPAQIDAGTIRLGSVGYDRQRAIALARNFEDTELGFLYETRDGAIGFDDRDNRSGSSVVASFSDDPLDPGRPFRLVRPRDWRGDIINRVRSEVAPVPPRVITTTTSNVTAAGVANDVTITVPAEGTGASDAAVGDVLIVVTASTVNGSGVFWLTPPGWANLRDLADETGARVYARRLSAGDFGDSVTFYDDTTPAGGGWVAAIHLVKNWYGVIESGVSLTELSGPAAASTQALAGDNDPPVMFTPWPVGPTLFLPFRAGIGAPTSGATVSDATDDIAPNGFDTLESVNVEGSTNAGDAALQWAQRIRSEAVSDPSPFGGTFTGFDLVEAGVLAIRGFAGAPPPSSGGFGIIGQNSASQRIRNAVLDHPSPGELFKNEDDAGDYNDLVLERFSADRPIVDITVDPVRDNRTRDAVVDLDLSDRIRIDGDGNSGIGVDAEYFVETITDTFGQGGTGWATTYACSPAVDPGDGADDPDGDPPAAWTLTDVDFEQFDTLSTDFGTDYPGWEVYDGPNSNGWGVWRPSAVSVEADATNGSGANALILRCTNGTGGDAGTLVSGGVKRLLPQTYCRVEARIRVDGDPDEVTSGVGIVWPDANAVMFPDAANASGTNGEWPAGGELDFFETFNNRDTRLPVQAFVHRLTPGATTPYDDSHPTDDDQAREFTFDTRDGTAWAKYVFDWRPDGLTVAIDNGFDQLVLTSDPAWIPAWPMSLVFQLDPFPNPATPTTQPVLTGGNEPTMRIAYHVLYTYSDL